MKNVSPYWKMFSLFMRYNFVLFNCQSATSHISHKGGGSINTISNLSKLIILRSTSELLTIGTSQSKVTWWVGSVHIVALIFIVTVSYTHLTLPTKRIV